MRLNKQRIKQFSLDDLQEIRQEESDSLDFFIARLGFIASGENRQDCWISEETIRDYAHTVKGKFVTAKYSYWTKDVMSHETDLEIIGYIPPESEITFERTEDGRLMAFCEAVLSKIYCYDVFKMFKEDNYRSVSAEFSCKMADENSDNGEIVAMDFHSITILGKAVNPAIPDANIRIMKFSQEDATDFYNGLHSENPLKKFSDDRKKRMSKKEDNMKKDKEEDIVMEEKEMEEKTIHCEEKDDDKKEKEKDKEFEIVEKRDRIRDEKRREKEREEDKEFEDQGDNEEKDDKEVEKEDHEEEDKTEKEMSDKKEEKKFSLNSYVDTTATLAFLEKETSERKELANKVLKEMDANKVFSTIMDMSKELSELKKYKADREDDERDAKFKEIMAEAKEDLDEKKFAEFYEEGKNIPLEEIGTFSNKVKAFAYDQAKKSGKVSHVDNGTLRFDAGLKQPNTESELTAEDIFRKHLQ